MEIQYLKLFYYAAKEKNLTTAANALYISQPALSMQLKKFEMELGIKLFDKVGNKNVLNDNGRILFEYAQKIFSLVEEAEHVLLDKNETISGTINIGGSNTAGIYILPKIIGSFKKKYPKVNVNLHVSDTNEIAQMISDNQLDFAMNGGLMEYGINVNAEILFQEKLVLIAAPESDLFLVPKLTVASLLESDFVTPERQSQLCKMTEKILEDIKLTPRSIMKFGSIEAIKKAVEADLGISLIPLSAIGLELSSGLLKELIIDNTNWLYPQSLIYNRNRYQSPASLKFMEHLITQTKERTFG